MKLKSGILSLIAIAILASCSTSNDVVSNRSIQKRKYSDGFYISFGKNFNKKGNETQKKETTVDHNDVAISSSEESIKLGYAPEKSFESIPFELAESPRFDDNSSDLQNGNTEIAHPLSVVKEEKNLGAKIQNFYPLKSVETKVRKIQESASSNSDVMLILLVILALILPPLAVFIFEGGTTRFVIDLILWLLGWGVGWYLWGPRGGLFSLAAVIYALLIVLSVI